MTDLHLLPGPYELEQLAKLPFVKWDWWTSSDKYIIFYGWIERVDAHEDFVVLTFYEDWWHFTTSSAKYSREIAAIFEMDGTHDDCKRIEDIPDLPSTVNAIKLRNRV